MIYFFIGTKAQLIKTAPVMRELKKRQIAYIYIHSGQHQETIDLLLNNFAIKKPDIVLHHGKDITKIHQLIFWSIKILFIALFKRKEIFGNDKKAIIVNHGDTFSALIGSLFAKLTRSKNAHIESGLRSFNLMHPFPEEITRLLVFKLTDYYFTPNKIALKNLSQYRGVKINTQQNTMYDATQIALSSNFCSIELPTNEYAIVSLHRYENIFKKEQLVKIFNFIIKISQHIPLVFILHKPTKQQLIKFNLFKKLQKIPRIQLYNRLDYFTFVKLLNNAKFLVSDGGSNQEESSYLGIPCLLLRKTTERNEGLESNVIISYYKMDIIDKFLSNYEDLCQKKQILTEQPSKIIVNKLLELLKLNINT